MKTVTEILNNELKMIFVGHEDLYALISDEMKTFAIEKAKQAILNYCNRCDIPKGAYYIWADMAIDVLRSKLGNLFSQVEGELEMDKKVSAIRVGDTNLSLGNKDTADETLRLNNMLLSSYATQLQRFRKLPNSCCCRGRYYDTNT